MGVQPGGFARVVDRPFDSKLDVLPGYYVTVYSDGLQNPRLVRTAPNGDVWITVVSELTDPENLREPFVQSTHFKRLAANATFKPEPCDPR